MAESFLFYEDYYKVGQRLPESERLKFYEAIIKYGIYDEPIISGGNPVIDTAMIFVETLVKANKKNRENGAKGGRPAKTKNPPKTPLKPNDNVNVNDNDNFNGNANANANGNYNGKVSPLASALKAEATRLAPAHNDDELVEMKEVDLDGKESIKLITRAEARRRFGDDYES